MHRFEVKGRALTITLTYGAIKAVKRELGIDLAAPEAAYGEQNLPLATAMQSDPLITADVAAFIIKDQLGDGFTGFVDGLDPEELGALVGAFWDEYRFFFQALKHPFRLAAIEKSIAMLKAAATRVEAIDIDSAISGISPTTQAESSASGTSTG